MNLIEKDLEKIIVVGDRLLLRPTTAENATASGLLLPPSVQEREQVQTGYVIKAGPGYPIPNMDAEESWKPQEDSIKYIPLQVHAGDLAVFLPKQAFEITFNREKYFIVSQSAILMVIRDNFLD